MHKHKIIVLVLSLGLGFIVGMIYTRSPAVLSKEEPADLPQAKISISMDYYVQVRSELNGRPLMLEVPARIYDNQALIPLQPLLQDLSLKVSRNETKNVISINNGDKRVEFTPGEEEARLNNQKEPLKIMPLEIEGIILAPTAIFRALGAEVIWDSESRVIRVQSPGFVQPEKDNRAGPGGVSILMYHEVGDGPNNLFLSEKDFQEQMKYLRENDYNVVTMGEARRRLENQEDLDKVVAITFDDGYRSFYDKVWPVLKEYGFTATVNVITRYCEADYPGYLDWEQLRFLQANWIEVGSHTNTHPALEISSLASVNKEVKGSKETIEQNLLYPCLDFCYPAGGHNQSVVQAVKEAGYRSAVTTAYGKAYSQSDFYTLPRLRISRGMSLSAFAGMIK